MRDSKFGLRAFGLALVAALGLMAFMAVAAQAEEPLKDGGKAGLFLVNKEGALAKPEVTFQVTQLGTGTLLVPTRVDILCTGGVVKGEFKTDVEALGSAEFTGCTPWSPVEVGKTHTTKVECTVNTVKEGAAGGKKETVIVKNAKALPKKHEGKSFVLLEEDGEIFTTIFLEGPACTLPKENKVTGSVVGEVVNSDTVNPTVVFSQAIQKLFQVGSEGDHLKYGALESYIDGSGKGELTDAKHVGQTVGVC
jgi:hypothetical protein